MKYFYGLLSAFLLTIILYSGNLYSQDFDGEWSCAYATTDDGANGTGIQTISVTVLAENQFVGLVSQSALPWEEGDACYIVGYRDADSTSGRLGTTPYGSSSDYRMAWINGFDQTFLEHARDMATHNNLVFVANNDAARNILVYEMGADSMMTHPKRMSANINPFESKNLWAIDVDDDGRVYVTLEGDSTTASEIVIFDSPENEPAWSAGHSADPLHVIELPDPGDARGITVTGDGQVIYVSNYVSEKIYCYTGNPTDGYELYSGFDFTLTDEPISDNDVALDPGPWGLNIMPEKNILFVACANDYQLGDGYHYGRYYALNPNTGEILDTIDCAKWNFDQTGAYSSRPGGTQGNVSGYTSPYNLDFDENFNVYTQSYYGWTVDKWEYSGTLPTIELTIITSIEKDLTEIPNSFNLSQNFPNPFNPSTTIEFSIVEKSEVTLSVYSITGELVSTLINGSDLSAGVYNVTFDASELSSGTYLYSISNGKTTLSKKMILLK